MGFTIKGILHNPIAVVHHLLACGLNLLLFLKINKDIAQILLIVNPGMATDANVCQQSVSAATIFLFCKLNKH